MDYLLEKLKNPTRLYIKQCSHCQLKYFGKSLIIDIENYRGSGKYWNRHLKKYNSEAIHLWHSEWYYDISIIDVAIEFSESNNIVDSKDWANLKVETGIDGGWSHIDSKNKTLSEKTKNKISKALKGTRIGKNNTFYGKKHSEETIEIIKEKSKPHAQRIYNERMNNNDHPNITKITCPHCNKEGQHRAMKRWHFDNCKLICEPP